MGNVVPGNVTLTPFAEAQSDIPNERVFTLRWPRRSQCGPDPSSRLPSRNAKRQSACWTAEAHAGVVQW